MDTKNIANNGSSSLFSTDIFDNVPVQEQAVKESAPVLTKIEQDIFNSLNAQEKAQITNVVRNMDLTQPNFTFEYGKEARQGIADVNAEAFKATRTKDLGEVGTCMSNLMLQLKGINIPSEERGIFKRTRSYIEQINAKLKPIEANVDKATSIMKKQQEQLIHDNVSYDDLYNKNLAYYRALTLYIIAGKMKLDEERRTTLVQLQKKAIETKDMSDVEAYNKYNSQLDKFDRLLNDFESSKTMCMQTAPMIRLEQEDNDLLIQKFDFIFMTAIPAWRIQIDLAIKMENTKQASNIANSLIDFTNDMFRINADKLKQGTIEVTKLSEREIIESDTLEYANQRLIECLDEVLKIREEGKAQREASREKRAMLEEDFKNELLQLTARR